MEAFQARKAAVQAAESTAKYIDAAKIALQNPPFSSKNAGLTAESAQLVVRVLSRLNDADLKAFVGALSIDEADVLMKYVYRGLQTPEKSATLFRVHAELVEKHGEGE